MSLLVCYIVDWLQHNTIRDDRKIDSIYQSLLLSVMPEAKLLESKPRSDVKNLNRVWTVHGRQRVV